MQNGSFRKNQANAQNHKQASAELFHTNTNSTLYWYKTHKAAYRRTHPRHYEVWNFPYLQTPLIKKMPFSSGLLKQINHYYSWQPWNDSLMDVTCLCFSTRNGLIQLNCMFTCFHISYLTLFILYPEFVILWHHDLEFFFHTFLLFNACFCINDYEGMPHWIVHNKTSNMHQLLWGETVLTLSWVTHCHSYIMCYSVHVTLLIHRVQGVRKRGRKKERQRIKNRNLSLPLFLPSRHFVACEKCAVYLKGGVTWPRQGSWIRAHNYF